MRALPTQGIEGGRMSPWLSMPADSPVILARARKHGLSEARMHPKSALWMLLKVPTSARI